MNCVRMRGVESWTPYCFLWEGFEMWEVLNLLEVIQESNKNFSCEEVVSQPPGEISLLLAPAMPVRQNQILEFDIKP